MPEYRILIVDDEDAIRELVMTILETAGHRCTGFPNGRAALDGFKSVAPDLVISDIMMPHMDGMTLLDHLHKLDEDVPFIMVTAMHDVATAVDALRKGAYDYILKPFERDQLHASVRRALEHRRLLVENRLYQRDLLRLVEDRTAQLTAALADLERSYDYTLDALGNALDLKDQETEGHSKRVTAITVAIARTMGVERKRLQQIARGAFLHDIGKMGVPDHILRKPGPLTEEERAVMRKHCEIGYQVLEKIPFLKDASDIVLSHQEHFDGSGYPRGIQGEAIPLGARIFAVADTLDAMISDRPYRSALPLSAAKAEIQRCAGSQFDPKVVDVFLAMPDELWGQLRENVGELYRVAGWS
ncbi:MAG: response regulator [Acidobacteria bacterium]|nr:response regulator [Acidobacteriota bacterium]